MARPILKLGKKYTFSDYFDFNNPPAEVIAELGYTLKLESLHLPQQAVNEAVVTEMRAMFDETMPRISMISEFAKREFLVAPVLREVVRRTESSLVTDYPIEVNDQLSGLLDYLLRATHKLIVIEAKKSDLDKGFTQLAAEMIAVDQYYENDDPMAELYGAVTIGDIWRFAVLHRPTKRLFRDLNLYRVPADLKDVLSILQGILRTDPIEIDTH